MEGLLKIFILAFQVSLASFGGIGSFWAILESQAGMECNGVAAKKPQFCKADVRRALPLSEVIPGPQVNTVSMSVFRAHGLAGMAALVVGAVAPGLLLVPVLMLLLRSAPANARFRDFLDGARTAGVAFLLLLCYRIVAGANAVGIYSLIVFTSIAMLGFVARTRTKVPPAVLILLGGFLGYFLL